ncbi:MAG TPA: protein kinase, partial [Thermoanaerobaculia bacterium]
GLDLSHLDRLLGDVVLEGEIARTAQAAVFRISSSRAHGGGASLALKVGLLPSSTEDLARFRHEVRLLSETRHPNVVEVYDFGVLPGDFPFFTMELLSGESVAERLRTAGWEVFYDAAIQVAAGLAHIHRQGIVHMDIKPGNLGLGLGLGLEKRAIKILDFGLAQEAHGLLDRRIRGTLAYTAPEVLLQDSYDHRADLYSLGITLFELATGVLPSAGDTRDDTAAIRFHLEGEPPDPLALRPDLPPELARILLRLIRRDPGERYASAGRLLVDLAAAAGRSLDTVALSSSEGQVLASRLVGRDEILGRLRGELAAAAAGRGGAVLLTGREGAGKSRLLRELRLLAALDGARVGRANTKSTTGSIAKSDTTEPAQPLAPFLEALAGLGIEVRPAEPRAGESGQRARYRLYREIALDLAAHAATGPPIVLLLDDLHLAGPESEELLAYLGEELRGFRVLVVATRRTAEIAAKSEDDGPVLRLDLEPLDRAATAQLVDACLGTAHLPAGFHTWMADETHGLPGDVQQVLRHLILDRVLLYRDGEWKPSLPGLSRWAQAP